MGHMKPLCVVNESQETVYESKCQELIRLGYRLVAANCGFVDSEQYDFCSSYQAVFILPQFFMAEK